MSKNIQTSLASKLQELSSSFRKQQASYLKSNFHNIVLGIDFLNREETN